MSEELVSGILIGASATGIFMILAALSFVVGMVQRYERQIQHAYGLGWNAAWDEIERPEETNVIHFPGSPKGAA